MRRGYHATSAWPRFGTAIHTRTSQSPDNVAPEIAALRRHHHYELRLVMPLCAADAIESAPPGLRLYTHDPVLILWIDFVPVLCADRAASRLPSYHVPLELANCSVKETQHCGARNRTRMNRIEHYDGRSVERPSLPRPLLFVAMASIPPALSPSSAAATRRSSLRSSRRCGRSPRSAAGGSRPAVHLRGVRRFPKTPVDQPLGAALAAPLAGAARALRGRRPGTKLLCALPRLRELARAQEGQHALKHALKLALKLGHLTSGGLASGPGQGRWASPSRGASASDGGSSSAGAGTGSARPSAHASAAAAAAQ